MSKTFIEVLKSEDVKKFNPYHDRYGRFTTGGGAASMTWKPGQGAAYDNAIAREKERTATATNSISEKATNEQKSKINNIRKVCARTENCSTPEFNMNKDGSINFSFTKTETKVQAHTGKMVDPNKDKFYERKTLKSGNISKDGFLKWNKDEKTDTYLGTRKQLMRNNK